MVWIDKKAGEFFCLKVGKLHTHKWQNRKSGQKRSWTEMSPDELIAAECWVDQRNDEYRWSAVEQKRLWARPK
jgi:hypothetical protein